MKKSEKYAKDARAILVNAGLENREATPEEFAEVEELFKKSAKARADEGQPPQDPTVPLAMLPNDPNAQPWARGVSPGEAFIQSEGYKSISDPANRPQQFSTGAIPIGAVQTKGTLLEGAGAPGSGTGGGLLPVPYVVPGVVEKLLANPLGVADLFQTQMVDSSTVRYVNEGTATSAAAGVAEAAAKPESTLGLSTVDEPVKKLATSITVSDELVEDAQATQGYVNGRLQFFIQLKEENSILVGGGTNDLAGLVGRSGVAVYGRGTVDSNAECIAKVIANTRGSSYVEPDAVIMNPANWLSTRLLKDSSGQYLGGGPFGGAYSTGNAGAAPIFGQQLWGKPVVLSDAIGAGTAIVGNFGSAAALARRGGITVEMTNSHSDYFQKNLLMVRAEERLALCVYRPNAFCVVSGLS